ncbi:TetR/AcrR family transcriptional regulator [Actinomadura geliboluensis]|uniref:TetR/AcrR family transcriptional regulator n=1 Tax=Actinomadura geliboluensis TaxID=882440 RepID=A0A5S4H7B1_9ACTN|nr:TetR/AcrR family transcriptional regulator [Actinomadura geliboluensis]TMR40621.1 TetR/AcrR family transcriptional regulator [Actinomadura geliboluensis]
MDKSSSSEADRIIDKATLLYAELGFDGTTTDMIAESARVDKAALRRLFPSSGALYRAVLNREMEAQEAAAAEPMATLAPTRQALERLVDSYLDFNIKRPELMKLLQHRRTGDAADAADIEYQNLTPWLTWMTDKLHDAVPEPDYLEYLLWTIQWTIAGFFSHGVVYSDPLHQRPRGEPIPTAEVEEFREYLHYLMSRLFELPEDGVS